MALVSDRRAAIRPLRLPRCHDGHAVDATRVLDRGDLFPRQQQLDRRFERSERP
jgi:hypothetical protein